MPKVVSPHWRETGTPSALRAMTRQPSARWSTVSEWLIHTWEEGDMSRYRPAQVSGSRAAGPYSRLLLAFTVPPCLMFSSCMP